MVEGRSVAATVAAMAAEVTVVVMEVAKAVAATVAAMGVERVAVMVVAMGAANLVGWDKTVTTSRAHKL